MTKLIAAILAAASLAILASTSAEARRHFGSPFVSQFCGDRYCAMGNPAVPSFRAPSYRQRTASEPRRLAKARSAVPTPRPKPATLRAARLPATAAGSYAARIVPNHPLCPRVSFCGCAAAWEVFGKNVRAAWLARWWFRFPVAEPAPGRVAVRLRHVFVIRKVIDAARGIVLAYDANSGGHKTRIHLRRLAGYSVRDPRGGRHASAL